MDVENREQAGDLDDVPDAPSEVEELKLALGTFDGAVGYDEFADPGAIDVIHVFQIEDDLCVALRDELFDRAPEDGTALAERNSAAEVDYGNISDLTACAAKNHGIFTNRKSMPGPKPERSAATSSP